MSAQPAVTRLEAALAEQARLGDQYARARGTSAELSTFSRLRTASLRVDECQRALEANGRPPARDARGAEFEFAVEGGVTAPGEARNGVAERLDRVLGDEELDTLRLLVSEVATNCVQHANASAGSRIDISVSLGPRAVRVELSTAGRPFEPGPTVRPVSADAGGRGLFILEALSEEWGVEPDGANTVWFELARVSAA
ncbi:MAG: ATP-binding protein [Thermoleophilaceae bacterium]